MMTSRIAACGTMMPLMWILPLLAIVASAVLVYFVVRWIVRRELRRERQTQLTRDERAIAPKLPG